MIETYVNLSLVAVYSALAVYALAFVAFTFDFSRRTAARQQQPAAVPARVGQIASLEANPLDPSEKPGSAADAAATGGGYGSRWARVGLALTVIGWLLHVSGTVLRGLASGGRVPWANMFEFTLTATALIIGVFLALQFWQDLRFVGAYVTGFVVLFLGVGTVNFYVDAIPLPPALQSAWLVIHVFVASLATAFLGLGAALSALQLVQARRAARAGAGGVLNNLPVAEKLENMAYRLNLVGFVFWTFTVMAGAIWAERAWGRYWGWDTKEVWSFIIWVIFAGYIHARATRGWRGSRSAWLAIIGFSAVIFNFTIVNLYFKGLHAYSGL